MPDIPLQKINLGQIVNVMVVYDQKLEVMALINSFNLINGLAVSEIKIEGEQ